MIDRSDAPFSLTRLDSFEAMIAAMRRDPKLKPFADTLANAKARDRLKGRVEAVLADFVTVDDFLKPGAWVIFRSRGMAKTNSETLTYFRDYLRERGMEPEWASKLDPRPKKSPPVAGDLTPQSSFKDFVTAMQARPELKKFALILHSGKERGGLRDIETVQDLRGAKGANDLSKTGKIGNGVLWATYYFLKSEGLTPEWLPQECNFLSKRIEPSVARAIIGDNTTIEDCCNILGYVAGNVSHKDWFAQSRDNINAHGIMTFGDLRDLPPTALAELKLPDLLTKIVEEKRNPSKPGMGGAARGA